MQSTMSGAVIVPLTPTQPPAGAMAMASPRNMCTQPVTRFMNG